MILGIFVSTVAGMLLLLWLIYNDFSKRIIKPIYPTKYYVAIILFSFVNILLYLGLCSFFLGIDPVGILIQPDTIGGRQFTPVQIIMPIIIAVMYFATGVFKFKYGNKEIDIYHWLLGTFQGILALKFSDIDHIQKAINKSEAEINVLNEKIDELTTIAKQKDWHDLDDRWIEIQEDVSILEQQSNFLSDVRERLVKTTDIETVRTHIQNRIHTLQEKQIAKLKRYILEFALKFIKKEEDIEKLIRDIGGENLYDVTDRENIVARCVVVCGLFGLMFGPVFGYFEGQSIVRYSWYGFASLGIFGFVFASVRKAKRNVKDLLVRAVLSGGLAGLLGHTVFMLLRSFDSSNPQPIEYEKLVFGLEFGAALGVVIFVFRVFLEKLSLVPKTILMAISGGSAFTILGIINNLSLNAVNQGANESAIHLMLFIIGILATLGVGVGIRIIQMPKTSG